jgi:hypothetical protein
MTGVRVRNIRSRQGRRARRAKQRLILAGGGGLAAAIAATLSIASFSGVDVAGAAVARAQSLADLLARRSPGERTAAHLIKTKHKHFAVLAAREQPELPIPAIGPPLVETMLPPEIGPLVPQEIAAFQQPAGFVPAVFAPVIGGGVFACCSGGGGGPGGGSGGPGGPPAQPPPNQPPPNQPPPPPAVPEPATWAMIIFGFGLTGWSLRRGRATARAAFDA